VKVMSGDRKDRVELTERIVGELVRRHSTATVLFHHAVATRLGLAPSDHKCLDLLQERGSMTGSELAASTGLTTGAITGVVARLEAAGHLIREPDPRDRRKYNLRSAPEWTREIGELFASFEDAAAALVAGFDDRELAAIATFLQRSTDFAYRNTALLRGRTTIPVRRQPAAPATAERP
jgi:DNA-binding MarR family transcriptional regulator